MPPKYAFALFASALVLAACSSTTMNNTPQGIQATTTGSVLFNSLNGVIEKTHAGFDKACEKPGSPPRTETDYKIQSIPGAKLVEEALELTKTVVGAFPSHTYTLSKCCPKTACSTKVSNSKKGSILDPKIK